MVRKVDALVLLHRVHGDDVGMVQGSHRLGFALEALESCLVRCHLGRQDLQCNLSFELGVLGEVDLPHSAFADLLEDLVVSQRLAEHDSPSGHSSPLHRVPVVVPRN